MNHWTGSTKSTESLFRLSNEGRLLINETTFNGIPLYHLTSSLSGIDIQEELPESGNTHIHGYTEWVSKTVPTISISWDWYINTLISPPSYEISGLPYSNIELTSPHNQELTNEESNQALFARIDNLDWQKETERFITQIYK